MCNTSRPAQHSGVLGCKDFTMTYNKQFPDYDTAFDFMKMENKASEKAGNKADILCVVPGHDDNYAVVDHMTAIQLGLGYVFTFSSTGWVANPWEQN